jgi:hypothetical protein
MSSDFMPPMNLEDLMFHVGVAVLELCSEEVRAASQVTICGQGSHCHI